MAGYERGRRGAASVAACSFYVAVAVAAAMLGVDCADTSVRNVHLQVDRSACAPGCDVDRFEVVVLRVNAAAECVLSRTTTAGEPVDTVPLPWEQPHQLKVAVGAFCSSSPDSGPADSSPPADGQEGDGGSPTPTCCWKLKLCGDDPQASNPACQEAMSFCPPEGGPFEPGWQAFYDEYCRPCCRNLRDCSEDPVPANPACEEAKSYCPQSAWPFEPGWTNWLEQQCGSRASDGGVGIADARLDAGPATECVRCAAAVTVSRTGDTAIPLQPATRCALDELLLPDCP